MARGTGVPGEGAAAPGTGGVAGTPAPARADWRWPALDGMRAVAVIAVAMYHIGVLPGGYLGVDVFFVLSGFLITSLLLREWDRRGRISFRDFYARRALRLFPALGCVLVVAAGFAWLLYLAGGVGDRQNARATLGAMPWVIGFAANWVRALDPSGPIGSLGALGHTWSLAVEEQFYLAWPALLTVTVRRCLSRKAVAVTLAILAVADMVYRGVLAQAGAGYDRIYYGADTHCDGLLIGCALAFWMASRQHQVASRPARWLLRCAAWAGAAVLGVVFAIGQQADAALAISAAVLATAAIVLAVVRREVPGGIGRLLCSRPAARIGQLSYGLYLWQYVTLAAAEALVVPATGYHPGGGAGRLLLAAALTASLGASYAAAAFSYRYIEAPALALRQRLRTERLRAPADGSVGQPIA